MYCKFDYSEMIFGPFEKMTFLGEHPLFILYTLRTAPIPGPFTVTHLVGNGKSDETKMESRRVYGKRSGSDGIWGRRTAPKMGVTTAVTTPTR